MTHIIPIQTHLSTLYSDYHAALKKHHPKQTQDKMQEIVADVSTLLKEIDQEIKEVKSDKKTTKEYKEARSRCQYLQKISQQFLRHLKSEDGEKIESMPQVLLTRQGIEVHPKKIELKETSSTVRFRSGSKENLIEKCYRKFINKLLKPIMATIGEGFYPLHTRTVKMKNLEKKYQQLVANKENLDTPQWKKFVEEHDKLKTSVKERRVELEKNPQSLSSKEIKQLIKDEKTLEKQSKKRTQIETKENRINSIEVLLKAKIEKEKDLNVNNLNKLPKEIQNAITFLLTLPEGKKILNEIQNIKGAEFFKIKGEKTVENLCKIGGERINVKTPSGNKLDGMFLDARAFRQKIADNGGRLMTLTRTHHDKTQSSLQALAFPYNDWISSSKDNIVILLDQLNALSRDSDGIPEGGAGWTLVYYRAGDDTQILLVPYSYLTDVINKSPNEKSLIVPNPNPNESPYFVISNTEVTKIVKTDESDIEKLAKEFRTELRKEIRKSHEGKMKSSVRNAINRSCQKAFAHSLKHTLRNGSKQLKKTNSLPFATLKAEFLKNFQAEVGKIELGDEEKGFLDSKVKNRINQKLEKFTQSQQWKEFIGKYVNTESPTSEATFQEVDTKSPSSGVVILSQGSAGVYEQYKSEALGFLFKGMDVVVFNWGGVSQSKGVPTEHRMIGDLESVYQFAKVRTGHPDNKFLLKGLCMSGGIAAKVAAKHPDTNIFLDQTYSEYRRLTESRVEENIDEYVEKLKKQLGKEGAKTLSLKLKIWLITHLTPLAKKFSAALAPNFNVRNNLKKNHGNKAIFYTHDDAVIPFHHVEQNIEAVAKAGMLDHLMVFSSPGEHANSWLKLINKPTSFMSIGKELKGIDKKGQEEISRLKNIIDECKEKIPLYKKSIGRREERVKKCESTLKRLEKKKEKCKKAIKEIKEGNVEAVSITKGEPALQKAELRELLRTTREEIKQQQTLLQKRQSQLEESQAKLHNKELELIKNHNVLEKTQAFVEELKQKVLSKYEPAQFDPNIDKSNFTVRLNVDHFLTHAGLNQDIIPLNLPTSTTKAQDSPILSAVVLYKTVNPEVFMKNPIMVQLLHDYVVKMMSKSIPAIEKGRIKKTDLDAEGLRQRRDLIKKMKAKLSKEEFMAWKAINKGTKYRGSKDKTYFNYTKLTPEQQEHLIQGMLAKLTHHLEEGGLTETEGELLAVLTTDCMQKPIQFLQHVEDKINRLEENPIEKSERDELLFNLDTIISEFSKASQAMRRKGFGNQSKFLRLINQAQAIENRLLEAYDIVASGRYRAGKEAQKKHIEIGENVVIFDPLEKTYLPTNLEGRSNIKRKGAFRRSGEGIDLSVQQQLKSKGVNFWEKDEKDVAA